MNLRLRLIVVFFLLSVVPVGAVTFYTYANNARAMRDAAGDEAELLARELSDRMGTMTTQLSQRVETLMELPEPPAEPQPAPVRREVAAARPAPAPAPVPAPVPDVPEPPTPNVQPTAADLNLALGELAVLINNIEVRNVRPGRRRGLPPDGVVVGPGGVVVGQPVFARPDLGPGTQPTAPAAGFTPPVPPATPPPGGWPTGGSRPAPGRLGGSGAPEGRGPGGPPPPAEAEPTDPNRIRIDLGGVRRALFQELVPDRAAFDALSPEQRQQIFTQIDQRMLGVEQGIKVLQQELASRALDVRTQDVTAGTTPTPATAPSSTVAAPPAPPAAAAVPPAPPSPAVASARPAATPARPVPVPTPPAAEPAKPVAQAQAVPQPPVMKRSTSLSGRRLAVKVERGGEVVGQVNADVDLPRLLAAVFAATPRDRGELPFAVGEGGEIYTPSPADKSRLEALHSDAFSATTASGTTVLSDWIVATTADPTGSRLKFGVARPVGEALRDLQATSARNAALGLAFIGLALILIVPLSGRLTRNLEALAAGVQRIAHGDYSTRVPVRSRDEIGRLAVAFNQMASDVEEHQRAAVSQERIRHELELGRQIQHDMLPQLPLRLGLTEVKGVSVPAREVGGDFFNYFQMRDGAIALLVGDVSGKGVGAALLMANLQAALRTRLSLGQDLASLAQELDVDIDRTTPGPVYATLFVGILDPSARRLRFVNAGHNPQYVLRTDGRLQRMESTGRPIGLLSGGGYVEQSVDVTAGDVLFFYTDGCVEAEDASGDMFGAERLEQALAAAAGLDAAAVMVAVEAEVSRFRAGVELQDDATMMVVKVG